jgi:glutathione peroxidase
MGDKTAFDFVVDRLTGGTLPLKEFAGRPMVIVNTASKCGFTPQYAALETLWNENRGSGLVVLGVPSNDFGGQEPGSAADIASFCTVNYGVDFPMAAKVPVKGSDAHPLFRWLADEGGFLARPRWNFYKYLIGRDGKLETWFSSITSPSTARFKGAIANLVARR